MCGIVGVVQKERSRPVSEALIGAMCESIWHRGPDDAGVYAAPGIGLGSRRLAILDLSVRGHMPMSTPDGRYQMVYNGEVYNFQELRSILETKGHLFRSHTDTEVLLTLYAMEGPAMLNRLNGMFAFAIWDTHDRTLFLARDRVGIKPLYYALHDAGLYFASEEKALFAAGVPREFDADTWEELLCFRFVAGERTPFKGVRRLLPGHCLLWRDGSPHISRWWNLGERVQALRDNLPSDHTTWFRQIFDESTNLQRISDVPVGVLLSGGLDSSSVAASLARQAGSGVASFTVRFREAGYDEGPLAQQVAKRWSLDYHELVLSPEELAEQLLEAAYYHDEPLAHGSDLYILAISRYAKSRVTVLLSGEGSDETMGGYIRYQPLRYPSLLQASRMFLPPIVSSLKIGGRIRKMSRFLELGSLDKFILYNACDVLPADLETVGLTAGKAFPYRTQVLAEARTAFPDDPMRQAMYLDQHTFMCSLLDRNDRMTMGASIECRVPFLDHRIVEGLAAVPSSSLFHGKKPKSLLRRAVGSRLPADILSGRKWGFGVPWGEYFRSLPVFRERIQSLVKREPIKSSQLDHPRVKALAASFLAGDSQSEPLIKQLLMMTVWHDAVFTPGIKRQQTRTVSS